MSNEKIPLTFGVELEMAVACLLEGHHDQNPAETRNVRFYPTQEDIDDYNEDPTPEGKLLGSTTVRCKKHIRNILAQAGLPVGMVEKSTYTKGDYTVWEVVDDSSITGPKKVTL